MRYRSLLGVFGCAAALFLTASPALAQTSGGSQSYQANLTALNHASGSGTLMLSLSGNQATITEHVTGLAATFMNEPYPHVQHIHINGQGMCPTASADKNGDDVVSTTEGQPAYGPIGTTLSTSGPTTAAAGTMTNIAPSGASFDYSRTIMLDDATLNAVKANKAVIVVHGLDPTTLSQQAQNEKSDLVPSLPLAATSPALCGPLQVSQTAQMPSGGVQTGAGGTAATHRSSTIEIIGAAFLGAALLVFGASRRLLFVRRTR